MMKAENHIDELIAKYLSGEAEGSEVKELQDWMGMSADNKRYFENEKVIFDTSSRLKGWEEYDADMAWVRLKDHLNNNRTGKIISFRPNFVWYSIAASILLVATLGYLFYGRNKAVPVEPWSTNSLAEVKQDTLPNGSPVFLNRGTEISYSFDKKDNLHQVSVQGEAYFDVDRTKEEGFQIEIGDLIIEDIGTSFNVNAYPKSELVTVIVEKGEVKLYTPTDPGIHVFAGETGIYNKSTGTFAKISEADPNALAYKTRYFSFNNTLLENVIASLNEVYNVNIMLSQQKLKNCRITVTFRDEEIDSIVDIIAATLELKVKKVNENEIILEGEGCDD